VSPQDLSALLERAREVQARMETLRRDLARRTVDASAGGGMVTVVATGELRILEVRIEPALLETGDRAMLQDLVAAAVNEALVRAQAMVQEELQRATGGLGGVPGTPG
jgi:DNA-binding YbaB/EbfC family protein